MKAVIIYYSYSGNTKKIAEMVQRETGFRAAELRTVVPYSENYDVVVDQGQDEVKRGFMPEILPLEVNPYSRPRLYQPSEHRPCPLFPYLRQEYIDGRCRFPERLSYHLSV